MRPLELPARAPKWPGSFDRCESLERTLALVPALRERYAITRVADTTHLDRTLIPTFAAIVPKTDDLISTYNGKGFTREASLCSAVMEAVERQLGASADLPIFPMSTDEVMRDLDLVKLEMREDAAGAVVDCVHGTDLLRGELIAVPMSMVQCPWYGAPLFKITSTNGLASGNTLTEAIYHALCELIERHSWSLYHTRSHLMPRLFLGEDAADVPAAPEVRFPTDIPLVDDLAEAISAGGLRMRVFSLEERPLPSTMLVSVVERDNETPFSHMGFGCSVSPTHAITRAITEAIQCRVCDIQAAREDILRSDAKESVFGQHGRRQSELPYGAWYFDLPAPQVELRDIPDLCSDDLAEDLRTVLEALRAIGASCVAVVDLSPPDIPIHVVRVIVPELESTTINGRVGPAARNILNPFHVATT